MCGIHRFEHAACTLSNAALQTSTIASELGTPAVICVRATRPRAPHLGLRLRRGLRIDRVREPLLRAAVALVAPVARLGARQLARRRLDALLRGRERGGRVVALGARGLEARSEPRLTKLSKLGLRVYTDAVASANVRSTAAGAVQGSVASRPQATSGALRTTTSPCIKACPPPSPNISNPWNNPPRAP